MPTTRAAARAQDETHTTDETHATTTTMTTPLERVARATSIFKPYDGKSTDLPAYVAGVKRTIGLAQFESYDETAMFVSACFQSHKQAEIAALVAAHNGTEGLVSAMLDAFKSKATPMMNVSKLLKTTQGSSTVTQYNERFLRQLAACKLDGTKEDVQLMLASAFVLGLAEDETRAFINTQKPAVASHITAATLAIQYRDQAPPAIRRPAPFAGKSRLRPAAPTKLVCYNCNEPGHLARDCRKPRSVRTQIAALQRELHYREEESYDVAPENE